MTGMRPGPRLLPALWVWLAFGALASLVPASAPAWIIVGVGLLIAAAADLITLLRAPPPTLTREAERAMSLGAWHEVTLRLENPGERPLRARIFDGYPVAHELEGLPAAAEIAPGGWAEVGYRLRPRARGRFGFAPAELLLEGPVGLLVRRIEVGEAEPLEVYPNFRAVSHYALMVTTNQVSRLGVHRRRRRGEGTEFYQLREYRKGDSLRQIDWKAVSRRLKLVSRDYQEERDQRVVFLLDCGRRLRSRDGDLSHFDHALNAVLLMTWVAVRQGDSVGLMTFSGRDRWLPPRKGSTAMSAVLNRTYDLETTREPSDYSEAARRLMARQRRRSLVVLVTNLRDEDGADLPEALALLRSRHLVLLASLKEPVLREALERPVEDHAQALRAASVMRYLDARKRARDQLRGTGVMSVDVEPAQLPVALVNRYLEIKGSGVL